MSQLKNELKNKLSFVILCAGEGSRLKKITKNLPKPLLKVEGLENESILQNIVLKLNNLEITKIIIITGHLGGLINKSISNLIKYDESLQKNVVITNSKNQYKLGPLYSFLTITKNPTLFNHNTNYILIPGDTIFDLPLLNEVLITITNNIKLLQKYPFVFYRNMELKKLKEIYWSNKPISIAKIGESDSDTVLKQILQVKIKNLKIKANILQIIPIFALNYDVINEISNLKKHVSATTVWEMLNYVISNRKKKILAFYLENKYQFFDIDTKKDLKKMKKKRKGQ